ncbi:MAG: hypothetical protein HKM05_05905 [Spirochaetales bacterium]|nr:hypothetical protein [Spirochaetales bacterium]
MAKLWFSCKALLVLMASLLLTSCLSLQLSMNITPQGGGTLVADFLLSPLTADIPVQLSATRSVTLPRTEQEWRTVLAGVPGTSLTAFQENASVQGQSFHVEVSFASPIALTKLFEYFGEQVQLVVDAQDHRELTLIWKTPNLAGSPAKIQQLWQAYWGNQTWVTAIHTPRSMISQTDGERRSANEAIWTVKESAFLNKAPPVLKVTW